MLALPFCPIILTPDSYSSINQSLGLAPLSNHHPVIFTAFVSVFTHIGALLGNQSIGVVLFAITQSAILAAISGYTLAFIKSFGTAKHYLLLAFAFYTFLPVNLFAGFIMWKDILFAGFGLLFLIFLYRLVQNFPSKLDIEFIVKFVMLACLVSSWRNNGFHAYIIFVLIFLLVYRRHFKSLALVILLPLLLVFTYNVALSLTVQSDGLKESLSIPLQQIGRTVKYHKESLTNEQLGEINEILPLDKIDNEPNYQYNPTLSDPMKGAFMQAGGEQKIKAHPLHYLRLYFDLAFHYKRTFIAAFLYQTYGYSYPNLASSTITAPFFELDPNTPIGQNIASQGMQIKVMNPAPDTFFYRLRASGKQIVDIIRGICPYIFNIASYTFAIILALFIALKQRLGYLCPIFIFLGALYFTTILGPVTSEFRYLYLFVLCTPLLWALSLKRRNNKAQD